MKIKPLPDLELLRNRFSYNPLNGELSYKTKPRRGIQIGQKAGNVGNRGYYYIGISRSTYLLHRVIWKIHYSEEPSLLIDHINGDTGDNRICNLRLATQAQNMMNSKMPNTNKTGIKGVYWCNTLKKWRAKIRVNGKEWSIGNYTSKELALHAIREARKEMHREFCKH